MNERVSEHLTVLTNLWWPGVAEHVLSGVDFRSMCLALNEEEIQERVVTLEKKRFGDCLPVAGGDREERLAELVRVATGGDVDRIGHWIKNVAS